MKRRLFLRNGLKRKKTFIAVLFLGLRIMTDKRKHNINCEVMWYVDKNPCFALVL